MRRPPQPELSVTGLPENTHGGACGVVKRAIVIGNGCAGAENQCIGLVRSLGLFDRYLYYSVAKPRRGINRWLQWLSSSLYEKFEHFIRNLCSGLSIKAKASGFSNGERRSGFSFDPTVTMADAKQISSMARRTLQKY